MVAAEAEAAAKKAAEAEEQCKLGSTYLHGTGGVARDFAEAARLLGLAADAGNANGQVLLGLMYRQGQGFAKDEAKASRLFHRAAEQGNTYAQALVSSLKKVRFNSRVPALAP